LARRDRESSTVLVSGLNDDVDEAIVRDRFQDVSAGPLGQQNERSELIALRISQCGEIRDINITRNGSVIAATVEFADRVGFSIAGTHDRYSNSRFHQQDSVPAALTKDRKKIGTAVAHVYQASQTTVFVTNFPAKLEDDTAIRELFASVSKHVPLQEASLGLINV
jgi:hypothetical protein